MRLKLLSLIHLTPQSLSSVVATTAAVWLVGCSSSTEPVVKTVTVTQQAASDSATPKKKQKTRRVVARYRNCDANIQAKTGTTTCAFANNVFYEFWLSGQSSQISAYSPAVGTYFTLRCNTTADPIVCRTTDGAAIKFSQAAVALYTANDAATYAATADLGVPPEDSGYEDESPGGSGCVEGYDPCLEPDIGDYDCEGGSGDGPNYTGPVSVYGSDPFDLDRDGNGYGCE